MPIEAWLRGPVSGVPPLLVPVAHMLQHAQDDAAEALKGADARTRSGRGLAAVLRLDFTCGT